MGVATANSILVVSFARERLAEGADALTAAIDAGFTRFRPVLMTALAMIIGMAPMALSAEQNAPLGRAVIGGLICSTVATLFFVPAVFRLVHANGGTAPRRTPPQDSKPRQSRHERKSAARDSNETAKQRTPVKVGRALVLLALVAAGVAAWGISSRRSDETKLAQWTLDRGDPDGRRRRPGTRRRGARARSPRRRRRLSTTPSFTPR